MTSADDDNTNLPPDDANDTPPPVVESNDSNQTFSFDESGMDDPEEAALNRRGSSLGGSSGKAIAFGGALMLGTAIILYYLFSDAPPPPQVNAGAIVPTRPSGELAVQPATSAPSAATIGTPTAPTAPPAPPPPPPPPPPPAPPAAVRTQVNPAPPKPQAPLAPPEIKAITTAGNPNAANGVADKRAATRMRSNMLLMNAGAASTTDQTKTARQALDSNDPNAAFASNAIAASETETAVATKLTNLNNLIAQGKIVDAVLETAINSDLPGTLRAIISRDVYAEAGKDVLIPKGSRLIGTYNTGIFRGQKRILIVWTRVITPNGTDIMIGSPGIDALGRAGVEGKVDNKYMESFSAAILTSIISVGVAVAADASIGDTSTTTSNTDGSSTSTGSAGAGAANSAVGALGGVGNEIVRNTLDLRPTITIDQGTRINVFVNKDLVMPGKSVSGGMFIQ